MQIKNDTTIDRLENVRRIIVQQKKIVEDIEIELLEEGFNTGDEETAITVAVQFLKANRIKRFIAALEENPDMTIPRHGNTILSADEKRRVYNLWVKRVYTQKQLAEMFNTSQANISLFIKKFKREDERRISREKLDNQ